MNIQSLSICVPANRCINDCEFCCSKMHGGDYEDRFSNFATTNSYLEDLRIRMQYARDNGCNTLMLTGNNEPQQNKDFLRSLGLINKSLRKPFYNIEMQTSGAFVDETMLDFLKNIGVTTMAISVACIDNSEDNKSIIKTLDKNLNIGTLCKMIKDRNMNLRICLNMSDKMLANKCSTIEDSIDKVVGFCQEFRADQITCRALWSSEDGTPQADWIHTNVTSWTTDFVDKFQKRVRENGRYLDTLEYGADRYDYLDFSCVVDKDSMAQVEDHTKDAVKYLIIRPNGHLYSKWDSKASMIF